MTDNCPRLFNWLCQNWKPCLSLNFQPNCPSLYAQNSRKSSSQLPAEPSLLFTSIPWSLCMCKLPTNVASLEFKYELCLSLVHIVATESCSFTIWNVQMHTTTRSGMQSGPCQRVYVSQPPKWWDCSHGWFGLGSSVCLRNVIRYSCPTWIAVSIDDDPQLLWPKSCLQAADLISLEGPAFEIPMRYPVISYGVEKTLC